MVSRQSPTSFNFFANNNLASKAGRGPLEPYVLPHPKY